MASRKKKPGAKHPKKGAKVGRRLAAALKQMRNALTRARKADPEFDRVYRRIHRERS